MKPEAALMMACNVYAGQVLPPECDYAATPIETGRPDGRLAAIRKAMGSKRGEPDARIIWRGRSTFLEYKVKASISDAQHKRHAELRRAGAEVFIVRSVATLASVFLGLGVPLRFHALTPERRDEMLAARAANPKRPVVKKSLSTRGNVAKGIRMSLVGVK